jgi:hypothetical protein
VRNGQHSGGGYVISGNDLFGGVNDGYFESAVDRTDRYVEGSDGVKGIVTEA